MEWLGRPLSLYALGPAALLAASADVARAYSPSFNVFIRRVFGPMMRAEELPTVGAGVRFNGATCVLVGAFLLALLFPLRVAVPVLVMTILGDATAALVGRQLGRHTWGGLSATLEGSAAFVGTGLLIMACFPAVAFVPGAAGVVTGAVAEALPLPVNDNIRVPVVAAVAVVGSETVVPGSVAFIASLIP